MGHYGSATALPKAILPTAGHLAFRACVFGTKAEWYHGDAAREAIKLESGSSLSIVISVRWGYWNYQTDKEKN